ncbi:hypothetical protein FOJ82_05405 [Tessaracoccus rhinocerotis]|uniref:Cell division topological specificity factor MinE n=1 Tax=Tessaracoccus rhinocerotis TaxID=1689449 RepID=A0A553K1I6_9ACTN|nr:hypothetical protein [Tessaracoccus rhinocerotis]TRY18566.1 hypothetical protein FOJ82_05405 [Tessaracoccus rhinocerotis]
MAGRHVATPSQERRIALTILIVGTVVSLASLLGGVWVVRAGVLLAIAMAFAAVAVARKQLERERVEHAEEIKEQLAARVALSEKHHADSVAMIERFGARTDNLKAVIANLRRQLGAANAELSSMRGNAVWLRAEVAERQARIDALTTRIAELEAEHSEKLVMLPRRGSAAALHPSAEDIWGEDEHPTMVDLAKLQLDGLPEIRSEVG